MMAKPRTSDRMIAPVPTGGGGSMRILAIDTALEACAAAVLDSDRGGITASETIAMTRGHAEAVMPLIARVMDLADIEFADLDRISVTTGPGTFTGQRVGLAFARALGLALKRPVIGVTTLDAPIGFTNGMGRAGTGGGSRPHPTPTGATTPRRLPARFGRIPE